MRNSVIHMTPSGANHGSARWGQRVPSEPTSRPVGRSARHAEALRRRVPTEPNFRGGESSPSEPDTALNSRHGLSLIEILAVVAIIAVLAGLLLPAITMVRRRSRCVVALAEIKNIETAWKKYFNEYNTWPTNLTETAPCALVGDRVRILEGENILGSNTRKLRFIQFRKLDNDDNPVNSWWREGRPSTNYYFYMKFDLNYNNTILAGTDADPPDTELQRRVLIWTYDANKNAGDPGYIIGSWQK